VEDRTNDDYMRSILESLAMIHQELVVIGEILEGNMDTDDEKPVQKTLGSYEKHLLK